MAKSKTPPDVAFLERYKIVPSGCWEWTGERGKGGYGQWLMEKVPLGDGRYKKHRIYAHRLSWQLHVGPIADGIRVLHRCDNPPCVNPDHLFLGTAADNSRDMRLKGRHSHGTHRPLAKLTEAIVTEILKSTETGDAVAAKYGVSMQTVNDVRRRVVWRHVRGERSDLPRENQRRTGSARPA